tara:strand:+ start:44 stop:589 length:546 start_codon:yes stop_codon:yes gene_type:complete
MTTNEKFIFSEEALNADIDKANEMLEKSNEEGFKDWNSLIDRLAEVSKHYIQYIQTADDEDEQAHIFQYKLDELTAFIMFAEKENFKVNHANLHELELYFLMQFHLREEEFDLALALGFITIMDNYLNKDEYDDAEEFEADLATIKEEFAEMYEVVATKLDDEAQNTIKQDPTAYYLSKIQ